MPTTTMEVVEAVGEALLSDDLVATMADEADSARLLARLGELAEGDFETVFIQPKHLGSAERRYTGADGFREGWLEWSEPYSTYRIEPQEIIDGPKAVVLVARQVATTKTDGVEINQMASSAWWSREGKLSRVEFHLDHNAALQAAGLP